MNRKPPEESDEIREEADYVNAPVCTVQKVAATSDRRSLLLIAACWLILLLIMGLRIYFTSVISENDAKLTAEIQELETQNQEPETRNQELETRNQELETQIRDMETNISRAQWSIDAYCPKVNNASERQCKACQDGWELHKSSCYVFNDVDSKTWEEARENCRGQNSDLVVVRDDNERNSITHFRFYKYWMGLRVEDGRWKWIDGTDLNKTSWITAPTDGHCAQVGFFGIWKSVSCDNRTPWICQKNALSV